MKTQLMTLLRQGWENKWNMARLLYICLKTPHGVMEEISSICCFELESKMIHLIHTYINKDAQKYKGTRCTQKHLWCELIFKCCDFYKRHIKGSCIITPFQHIFSNANSLDARCVIQHACCSYFSCVNQNHPWNNFVLL